LDRSTKSGAAGGGSSRKMCSGVSARKEGDTAISTASVPSSTEILFLNRVYISHISLKVYIPVLTKTSFKKRIIIT
jgi:hypothetical protein